MSQAQSPAPIAIVGQSCVLPGALRPEELWARVEAGEDLLTEAPADRWGIDRDLILFPDRREPTDATWSDRGGYVEGFESVFDPGGFAVDAEMILPLDPLFHWVLHGGREALRDAGHDTEHPSPRVGGVIGNLSFPSVSLSAWAESVWCSGWPGRAKDAPHPVNRFMSGLPAHLLAQALRLEEGAFALDAACASSLYAIKLACDRLHDGRADLMLAGAVNRADDLFIHVGFCALQAMSRSGRSRPFHREADGLVPAEGAAFVVLKRLADAEAAGDRVLGVIRSIGLSNDGRGAGLLAPSAEGQVRAMRLAYQQAGLQPSEISLVECHATGTPVGDGVELQSSAEVFAGSRGVPIGSLKSNLGHLITTAGTAGLLKLLGALRAGIRPATLHAEAPLRAIASSPFRLLSTSERWSCPGPRRAALSAFGFGGNNAHLILEEAGVSRTGSGARLAVGLPSPEIAIVGLGVIAADALGTAAFTDALLRGESRLRPGPDPDRETGHTDEVALDADGLRFPPLDLEKALAQQTLLLAAAREAVDQAGPLPRERTAVLAGMQTDAEVARFGARWRAAQWARQAAPAAAPALEQVRDSIVRALDAPGVVGTMPNIVANRLNSQLDLAGPSLTVSAEEVSGLRALELAVRALREGEVDAALVGAVDVSAEPAHGRAAAAVLPASCQPGGDAAVAVVLKREEDAARDGNEVLATVDPGGGSAELLLGPGPDAIGLTARFGHAHAASGLLHLAAATLACRHRVRPPSRLGGEAAPWLTAGDHHQAGVLIDALGGARCRIDVVAPRAARPLVLGRPSRVLAFCGADVQEVLSRLRDAAPSREGAVRLAIVSGTEEETRSRIAAAREALSRGDRPDAEGAYYRTEPLGGELAFVFTGPAGAYRGMGNELLMALPALTDAVRRRFHRLGAAAGWAYAEADGEPAAVDKLWGASFLCQAHAELSGRFLGLRPEAAIGFCSGETNALFALGAWDDIDDLHDRIEEAGVYSRELAGECRVPQRAWGQPGARFTSYRVLCPLPQVREALEGEARCHLTIINAPGDAVIGGEAEACRRVVARLGPERARPLGYDIAVHCPEMELFRDEWRRLHHRPTRPVPGVRFYTHATGSHYRPDSDSAAEALVGQALQTVDFPRLVENAWQDGVRVFLEHGPQAGCSRWIERILGDRDHVAVSLDLPGRSSLEQLAHARARLIAAGVELRDAELEDRLEAADLRPSRGSGRQLRFRVHRPQPVRPSDEPRTPHAEETTSGLDGFQSMPRAPELPPVIAKAPPPPATPTAPVAPPAGTIPDGLRELVAQQTQLATLHREFLERQSALHRSFLAVRARPLPAQTGAAWLPVEAPGRPESPAAPPPPPPGKGPAPGGLHLTRQQLEVHASGPISSIFGPLFEQQDGYRRQVRMPEPPLLLADRVTGITGEPGSMGLGKVFTETDVAEGAWYLHEGRMPAGVMIEAGQADLLLISWLGIDFLNRGERVYRLLGCELTYHGGLPRAGDTLEYEIEVDGHAQQEAVRLFFFHYDCRVDGRPRLSVRGGQAGFFTDEELAETGGVLWEAENAEHDAGARLDPPVVPAVPDRLDRPQLDAMAAGRVAQALGPGFERAASHVQTPRIPPGRLQLLQRVDEIDPAGGPWGRGYLRASWDFSAGDWFFAGHFKNDPCMPGTLMFEGCLSAMAAYLTVLGFTLDKDGWRFEPVPDEVVRLRCRGQAVPSSRRLTYELFVEELRAGPEPTLYADLLCTVDGVKAFHARRMGLRLVPDWPLTRRPALLAEAEPSGPAVVVEGHRFDHRSLLACAWDRPSLAFGELYRAFDGARHLPRLPAPPYQFMTRVTSFQGQLGSMRPGSVVEAEYRVPDGGWYFDANGSPTMPFSVLLEAHLQPCGWLALATGIPRATEEPLYFRNLDGTGTLTREVPPGDARLRTRTKLTGLSASGGMYLVTFDVEGHLDEEPLFRMSTGFGFFPAAALLQQVGLPRNDSGPRDGAGDDAPGLEGWGEPVVARPPLLMLDRVVSYTPAGGKAGLGRLWAQKDVDPGEWFFRAHFYQDPVQPGSLGLEAMLQLLKVYMLERGLDRGIAHPRFEPLALGRELTWKYRGQVLPHHRRVSVELEVDEVRHEDGGPLAVAQGWLWVDGTCIYHAQGLALRLVAGPAGR